ncbi:MULTISPECIES: hypothetical protein [unclassified Agarivorans]|uniref:hypothetical protein n=1 Tax=unclassified Agarivorans TaxID=2636026 RepID=UPI0026E305A5|nr:MULTISPECIES: hypothetical protein [unclassified Agarivorans]MDO6684703.1 hypothetical protein [Agarivorans sp. 3_MG-2023]MDO6715136.1 hypothetical protein [Agarivorans sp. 2_MG-2023]
MSTSNSHLNKQLAKASLSLLALREALDGDSVDLKQVESSLTEHHAIVKDIFEGSDSRVFSADDLVLLNEYSEKVQAIYSYFKEQRLDIKTTLGSLKRGQKVVGAYFKNL